MSFKKEDDERRERAKKRNDQRSQARTSKWGKKLFIRQRISSRTACFSRYLRDEGEATWRRWEVTRTKETRISTQLLDTIFHDWKRSYSLFHCWRRRVRRVLMRTLRRWVIARAARRIDSWRWRETEFIMQSCFSSKQYSHLRARSMRARHVWVVTALRRRTQRQHQIIWSSRSIMCQRLSKHAEIDMHIKNREFSHQRSRREKSRRSRRDRRRSDDDVKRDVHLKKMSRLREHVSMISVSANAATYHDSDDDNDDVDTAMSLTLAHELTRITTTLQWKKLISWAASYARYA